MKIINGRYKIIKHLHTTSYGKIYKVIDNQDNTIYNLSLLNRNIQKYTIEDFAEVFFNYTKIIHPHILRDYRFDIVNDSNLADRNFFYVYEHINLNMRIKYNKLNFNERLLVLEKVIYALKYIHFKKMSYGTLSFDNIYIFKNERDNIDVKLNNFANIYKNPISIYKIAKNEMESTLLADDIDNSSIKSDVYNLATICYYLITGKNSNYDNIDLDTDIKAKYPKLYSALSLAMEAYEYRPDSIDEIWSALNIELGISNNFWDKSYYQQLNYKVDLIGQQEQLKQTQELIDNFFYANSNKNLALIRSGIGIGKTRFLTELKHKLNIKALNPVYCDFNDLDNAKERYCYTRAIAKKLLKKFKFSTKFINQYGADIIKLVPELAEIWNIKSNNKHNNEIHKSQIFNRALTVLNEIAKNHNFVIIIDDVDKMNQPDLELLAKILKNKETKKPFVLLSINDMPLHFQNDEAKERLQYIELSSFNHHHTVEYLKKLLYIDTSKAKFLARDIYPLVHGNPKNIKNVIADLVASGNIHLSKKRKFKIRTFSLKDIHFYNQIEYQKFTDDFNQLSEEAQAIAKCAAVFAHKFNLQIAANRSRLAKTTVEQGIEELLNNRILRKLNYHWNEYYEFYDYKVLGLIYINLSPKESFSCHNQCKEYYESLEKIDDAEFDSYIFHLINSNYKIKAIDKLIEKCQQNYIEKDYYEILDYISFAKTIEGDINCKDCKLKILFTESQSIREIGKVKYLIKIYKKMLALASDTEYINYKIYTLIKLCNLYLSMHKIADFQQYYQQLVAIVPNATQYKMKYDFNVKLLRLKFLSKSEQNQELKIKAEELSALFDLNNYPQYHHRAKYYVATSYHKEGDYIFALNMLTKSLRSIDKKTEARQAIKYYNFMGEICQFSLFDNQLAHKYFNKAKQLLIDNKFDKQYCELYFNIAINWQSLQQYDLAYKHYLMAEKIAASSLQYHKLFGILNASMELLMLMNKYQLAENKCNKFKQLMESTDDEINASNRYYNMLLEANINLVYRNLASAKTLLLDVKKDGLTHLNRSQKIDFFILEFIYNYILGVKKIGNNATAQLKVIASMIETPAQSKAFRSFMLNLAIHFYALQEFDFYSDVIDILNNDFIFTHNADIKQHFIDILNDDCNLKKLKLLLFKYDKNTSNFIWKLFYIIGKLEEQNDNPTKAVIAYYEAINKYWDRISNFPEKSKYHDLKNDIIFKQLINDFNNLRHAVYFLNEETAISLFKFNDPKLRKEMLADNKVKNAIGAFYIMLNNNYIPDVNDYMRSINDDHEKNIDNMLLYFTHTTLAEKAYIMIIDDDKGKKKIISAMNDEPPAEFNLYIESIRKPEDFIHIKRNINNYSSSNASVNNLGKNYKDVLVFPICKKEYTQLNFNRKSDYYSSFKENIVAYVYLESSLALNQVNLGKLTQIRTYDGLNSLVINNYNMYIRSSIDNLTGILIRNIVEKYVDNLVQRTENLEYNFSLFMIDIDKFKHVNDNFGHRRGDEVLIKLAQTLKNSLRKEDLVGRYGGEEFIVVINNSNKNTAYTIAEKLRDTIEKTKLMGNDGELTVSIGVSTYPNDGTNFAQLVENADKALYHSKDNGRNRVTSYSSKIAEIKTDVPNIAGVFSIDASENAIKTKALLDIVSLLSWKMNKKDKINKLFELILDIIDGKAIFILQPKKDDINLFRHSISKHIPTISDKTRQALFASSEGGIQMNWEENNNYCYSKIIKNGHDYGVLLALSNIELKEYNYKDYNFLLSVSPIVASILDAEK